MRVCTTQMRQKSRSRSLNGRFAGRIRCNLDLGKPQFGLGRVKIGSIVATITLIQEEFLTYVHHNTCRTSLLQELQGKSERSIAEAWLLPNALCRHSDVTALSPPHFLVNCDMHLQLLSFPSASQFFASFSHYALLKFSPA